MATLTLLALAACSNVELVAETVRAPAGRDAGEPAATPWGVYAAALALPDCPASAHPPLIVSTTSGELELPAEQLDDPARAGAELSLVEALAIAGNRPGSDTVLFDTRAFPPEDPATIQVPDGTWLDGICLDGRGRGVILAGHSDDSSRWLAQGSTLLGLTLSIPLYLELIRSRVAGCRIDGLVELKTEGEELVFGPKNAVSARYCGLSLAWSQGGVRITGNDLGLDPVLQTQLELPYAFKISDLTSGVVVEGNRIVSSLSIFWGGRSGGGLIELTDNAIGKAVGEDFTLQDDPAGLALLGGAFKVGPGNAIQGAETAIWVALGTPTLITRNSITGNGAGIVHEVAPVAPPVITAVTPRIEGTCPAAGKVEVFADPADQGELFLGVADCEAGGAWSLDAALPAGLNATATLTDPEGRTSAFSPPFAP